MTENGRKERIDRILQGAVDLHVHSGPSLHPRKIDHIEALKEADAAGFRAVLLKDHYYPTMPFAHLLNKHLGLSVKTIGAIVLNNPVGSLNPSAVDYALKQGARTVWMATAHAHNHMEHEKKDPGFKNKFPVNTKKTVAPVGVTLVDEKGVVRDEVKLILDLIAQADAAVSGGHHHIDELWPFFEEAKARGVKRMFLNHPTYVNAANFQDISRLVSMGVKIEHSICMFVPSTFYLFDKDHLRAAIDAAGVENTFFGSDLGQNNNPTPVEGFRQIADLLLDLGYGDDEVHRMLATNAADFIGIE